MSENLLHLLKMAAELFRPAKHYPTKEFMEAEYVLPDFGEYDFRNAPYFLGVALALDDPDVDEVDLMKAAQIGWTFFILGYIFKRVVEARYRPCPIMMLFAKAGDGKALHDEKLVMAGEATRAVAECIDFSTSPKSGNRWDLKKFDGG
ncbi:phage terminase large subunit family protein [Oceanospirillum sediminis]|uniref:Phage terminase large subunit family protein n=1 Tax=Oceanospirillum sediminis TaxID=2760088 RepID=A0A839IYC7_9GAMM|nr:phage terminase large subunit family protein [Oceanospirillum sediminis]MBB1489086.1 phage terminase large subunit family protein [Oceanospirillum sediminis]